MGSDAPELGFEGIALANELALAFDRSPNNGICEHLRLNDQEAGRFTVSRYGNAQRNAADLFRCVHYRRIDDPAERQAAVASHVRAGMALSDHFCTNFFDRIAENYGKRRFGRNVTNDVGTMVSTVLGLAAAGSGVTGGIGAAFGLLDGTWRNYDESFLVDADLPTLQGLVMSEQQKFRRDLPDAMPDNFFDGTNVILRYANLCSFVGMRRLMTATMRDRTVSNAQPGEQDRREGSPENQPDQREGAPPDEGAGGGAATNTNNVGDDPVRRRFEEFVRAYEEAQRRRGGADQPPANGSSPPPGAQPQP
jgi:hypothetical protein